MDDMQHRLRMALATANMAIWDSIVVGGNILEGTVDWSPEGAGLLGLARQPLRQSFRDFLSFVHPEDRDFLVRNMQERVDECGDYEFEYRVVRPDASVRWLSAKAQTICDQNCMPERTLGIIWDITERKRQEMQLFEEKELAEVTLSSIGDGVVTTDEHGRITFLNRIAEQMTGWSSRLALGVDVSEVVKLVDEANGEAFENVAHKCLRLRQAVGISSRSQLITREGRRIAVDDSAAPIWSKDGHVLGAVAVFHDVSHERKLAHQLSWQAAHDALTGLINRREFENHIATALHSAKNEGHHHALLFMDLDRFKIINDTCGHGAGDVLLQLLSRMLQTHMRESDVLARLGGDELGVLLSFCPPAHAITIANDIRQSIKDFRFVWDKRTFEIGVSIGMVQINEDSKSMSELLVAADQACYVAKEQGRNRVHIYRETDVMLARRHGETLWVARLNEAFQLDRFRLFGQPIMALRDHALSHEEVLIRIASLDRYPGSGGDGLILPGAFIPAAERFDLMVPIDRWVIRHVCRHIHGERAEVIQCEAAGRIVSAPPQLYSVNLSGISLNDDGMLDHIKAQFEEYGIEPSHICFEITETAIIANLPKAQQFMESLRELGCRFSLDDFGSGLSSFAYLRSLPVDFLKIDGVFIRDIANNEINRAMVKAINEVGHVMGIATVAEYVEDEPTLEAVRDIGIDYAQGYAVGHLHPLTKA